MDAGGWSEAKADRRQVASEALLEGLHTLGLDVANVSGRDLLIGAGTFETFQENWPGTFVSANIEVDGKPLFATHTIVERTVNGVPVRVGITGVTLKSRAASETWEGGELRFSDPLQAARRLADEMAADTDLRVLLAHMSVSDLENFVQEFPDAYQVLVSGNGELRTSTPLGAPPFVLAPGTSGKRLAWVNVARPTESFEVTAGNALNLDEKVQDDPETAARVVGYVERIRGHLQSRSSGRTSSAPVSGEASTTRTATH